jgi:hypothetical protein
MINIPPINKSIPVVETIGNDASNPFSKAKNFLSGQFLRWLQSVESRLNKAVVTDENGNIAYGGAVIPDDVETGIVQYFHKGNSVKIIDGLGTTYISVNAYVATGGIWKRLTENTASLTRQSYTTSIFAIFSAATGVAGSSISWAHIFNIDNAGNVNIKTGSTYTATL